MTVEEVTQDDAHEEDRDGPGAAGSARGRIRWLGPRVEAHVSGGLRPAAPYGGGKMMIRTIRPVALMMDRAPLIGLVVILADQLSKAAARVFLPLCEGAGCSTLRILGPVGFLRVENRGSAFGLVQGFGLWTVLAIVGLLLIPVIAARSATSGGRFGTWLLLGGAVANLLDRLIWGGVTDFLDPGGFVVFNVADVALLVGCVLSTRALAQGPVDTHSGVTGIGGFRPV